LSDSGVCVICNGNTKNMFNEACTYCNGTGEWNQAGENYLKNHICQCKNWDRKNCPICKKICHHDSALSPKQRIVPGFGGMTAAISVTTSNVITITPPLEEEFILI